LEAGVDTTRRTAHDSRMLKYGQAYRDAGERYYEEKYQHHLQTQAAAFGFQLTPHQAKVATVS
jgi:hypothetical protein